MDFTFRDEDLAVQAAIARFAERELAPHAAALDEEGRFAARHLPALAATGVMGLNLPERWGGAGISAIALFLAVQAIAGACASTASMVTAHYLATDAILLGGDDALRERYLPPAATGSMLGAFALTEPGAGSNPAEMTTHATRAGERYRLQGAKQFISNAGAADFLVVFAATDPALGTRGVSAFVVERTTPGVSIGPAERTMGLKAGHVFAVGLDAEVPAAARIGAEGSGFRTAMRVLDNGRVEIAAMCVGIAEAALGAARSWAKERQVSGHPIGDFQGLQWMLADMATALEASRWLGFRAASLRERGQRFSKEAAMAKLHASEMVAKVTDLALQIHGGYGYTRAFPLERYVRDGRIMRIFEGSSEVQRNIIGRAVLQEA